MKKKLIIIIPVLVALLTLGIVYLYYNREDRQTSFTVNEKKWIENNSSNKIDIDIPSDLPVFSNSGSGVISSFITNFEDDTKLSFNKKSYQLGQAPSGSEIKVEFISSSQELSDKNIEINNDYYVFISKNNTMLNNLNSLGEARIGILQTDLAELTYYIGTTKVGELVGYESYEALFQSLELDEVNYVVVPYIETLSYTISSKYYINYNMNDFYKRLVLTLGNTEELNSIIKKYYENWKNKYYVTEYNKTLFKYYIDKNEISDRTKTSLISKNYVYGYTDQTTPYELTSNNMVDGIASEYINRLARLTGITIDYKKYSSIEDLKNGINNNEVDIFFNYDNITNDKYTYTVSPFKERYVVLGNKNEQVISFEGLKGKSINILKNNALFDFVKDYGKANINECDNINCLKSNNNIMVLDKEVYEFYKKDYFMDYNVYFEDEFTYEYNFGVKKEEDNDTFFKLLNYIITTNSYENYRNQAISNLTTNAISKSSFTEFYIIILGIVLLPILVLTAIYIFLKKKKQINKVKKEDRRKYTDLMTGLKNRNYLNYNIESWDNSDVYPQGLVVVDLNNVKYVNDNHGHEAGDNLIIKAAGILVNTQLENSEIIRTDGNEFLVYLVGYSESQVGNYVKKLTKEMTNLPYGFGASIGFSMIVDDIKTIDDAINEATLDMRTNKESSR